MSRIKGFPLAYGRWGAGQLRSISKGMACRKQCETLGKMALKIHQKKF